MTGTATSDLQLQSPFLHLPSHHHQLTPVLLSNDYPQRNWPHTATKDCVITATTSGLSVTGVVPASIFSSLMMRPTTRTPRSHLPRHLWVNTLLLTIHPMSPTSASMHCQVCRRRKHSAYMAPQTTPL